MTPRRFRHGRGTLVVLAAALLGSCAQPSTVATGAEEPEPAHVEAVGEDGVHRITLEDRAVARLGLETGTVTTRVVDGRETLLVAHSAVVYDPDGVAWAYTETDTLTYERARLEVERVVGDDAHLESGPPAGTEVVTVGAAELYGAEHDVGH